MAFVKVAKTTDLENGACMTAQANGQDVALYHVGETFYASTNVCPHRGGPLGEGLMEGPVVTCPWHGWQYDVCQGKSTSNPGVTLKTFPVKIEGDDVLVDI